MNRGYKMKRLLLWGFIISLLVAPCYAADVKVSALPDGTVASTWVVVCEAGSTPTLSKCTVSSLLALKIGTVTSGKVCLGDAGGLVQCTTDAYQAALTYPVTGVASPTAGYMTKWGVSGNAIVDGPKIGNFTDTKWCVFTTAGGLECTTNAPAGAGDFKADGTVPMTAAIVPNAANTIALGSATAEWADLYLGDGAIVYGQNDQSATITSSATGWLFNKRISVNSALFEGGTNTFNITNGTASLDVAAGAALNIDTSLTVQTAAVTLTGKSGGSTITLPTALSLDGTMTNTYLCKYTAAGTVLSCDVNPAVYNGTVGATTPAAGKFTTIEASTSLAVTAATTTGGYIRLLEGTNNGTDYSMITGAADAGTYPSFTFSGSQGAEDLVLTASNNLWTFSSTTAATVAFTPSVALNGGASVGGTLALGANNITSTGSLGATGAGKLTKVWAVDAETTNIPTVGGTGILTSLTAPQFTTIELGAASDTTLARVSAGVVSIEGNNIDTYQTTIDGSAHVHLTAIQMQRPTCHVSNYGQTTADVSIGLPTAAANLSCLFTVSTARSNHWGVLADTNDAIYIAAAAGTISAAGTDGAAAAMVAAQLGQSFACWSIQTGASAWDWVCKGVVIGTSTFEAHAAF
jgi:hypothetical protein